MERERRYEDGKLVFIGPRHGIGAHVERRRPNKVTAQRLSGLDQLDQDANHHPSDEDQA